MSASNDAYEKIINEIGTKADDLTSEEEEEFLTELVSELEIRLQFIEEEKE